MKKNILFALIIFSSIQAYSQPTTAQWNAFLIQYKADTTYKGRAIRELQTASVWVDPKYFKVTTNATTKQDSLRLVASSLPSGGGSSTSLDSIGQKLADLILQFNTLTQWASNNVDGINQKIAGVSSSVGMTNTNLSTLSASYEQTTDMFEADIADLQSKISALQTSINDLKKNIPNRITYPQ